jgi:hypothetical protein
MDEMKLKKELILTGYETKEIKGKYSLNYVRSANIYI